VEWASALSGGLRVEFRVLAPSSRFLRSVAAGEVDLGFSLNWQDGRGPASGLEPFVWISRLSGEAGPWDRETCEESISRLARGGMEAEQAMALNQMQILTINQDNTLSIINPRVNMATANLQTVIPLGGTPLGASLEEASGLLFLIQERNPPPFGPGSTSRTPGAVGEGSAKGELVTVDLNTPGIRNRMALQAVPERMWRDPGTGLLWVASQDGQVSLLDGHNARVIRTLSQTAGYVELAFDPQAGKVFLADGSRGEILVLDGKRGEPLGSILVQKAPLRLAYSGNTGLLYAVNSREGGILILDPVRLQQVGHIPLAPGTRTVQISPDGRFLMAIFPEKRALAVVDLRERRVVQRGQTRENPAGLEFSSNYGYVHDLADSYITLFRLADLGEGPVLPVLEVPVGTRGEAAGEVPGELPRLAVLHQHGGALVAHRTDRMLYHYMEGMMAPMSGLRIQTALPRGVFIYHRRMEEAEPGHYLGRVRLATGGLYQVLFHLPKERASACFELAVEGTQTQERDQAQILTLLLRKSGQPVPGKATSLVLSILDESTGDFLRGLGDLRVMAFAANGNWQMRAAALEVESGLYQVSLTFPRAGQYYLLVQANSRRISFGDLRHAVVEVKEPSGQPASSPSGG
jgi:DNA-binding beta-propeller fold protein YncE